MQAQAAPLYKQFGNMVLNVNDANKPIKWSYFRGTVSWVHDGIIGVDVYRTVHYGGHSANSQQAAGAYSSGAVGGFSEREFDRTVAVTNFPDIKNATIDEKISIEALRIGTFEVDDQPIEFYDCGKLYVPPPPSPAQIKAEQEAAHVRARADKKRAEEGMVKWLKPQATNGDASAQCKLGIRYLNGQGCETNREQAAYWLQKAAAQGNSEASNRLAIIQK